MIQEVDTFLKYFSNKAYEISDLEKVLEVLKRKGANQMTCTKVVKILFKLNLGDAHEMVNDSEVWKNYKSGNDSLQNIFFNDET
jgi:hypothetical protein